MKTASSIYNRISEWGTVYSLSFTCQEPVGKQLMAFDSVKKKLLIIDKDDCFNCHQIISLHDVSNITLHTAYKNIPAGALNRNCIDTYIKNIYLQFNFRQAVDPVALVFYEWRGDDMGDSYLAGKKAKKWQTFFLKLISKNN